MKLTVGCDANSHQIIWGSMDRNPWEEYLMEYLVHTNLNIRNKGGHPTFVISNRKKVRHLTLRTDNIADLVTNWYVTDETSSSDYIFQVTWNYQAHIPQPQNNKLGNPTGKIVGKSKGCTKRYTLSVGCWAGYLHDATGHLLVLSPKLHDTKCIFRCTC
jgi:hypothetical protein